jgi:hypothetical protein
MLGRSLQSKNGQKSEAFPRRELFGAAPLGVADVAVIKACLAHRVYLYGHPSQTP